MHRASRVTEPAGTRTLDGIRQTPDARIHRRRSAGQGRGRDAPCIRMGWPWSPVGSEMHFSPSVGPAQAAVESARFTWPLGSIRLAESPAVMRSPRTCTT
jgi:hypothetical protein